MVYGLGLNAFQTFQLKTNQCVNRLYLHMMKQIVALCEEEIRPQMIWIHRLSDHLNSSNEILADNAILSTNTMMIKYNTRLQDI